jgi:hypothetical protein
VGVVVSVAPLDGLLFWIAGGFLSEGIFFNVKLFVVASVL